MTLGGQLKRRAAIAVVGGALVIATGPLNNLSDYLAFVMASAGSTCIAVMAVSLLAGRSGIWSLGHTAFLAIGAYLTANLPPLGVPLEGILAVAAILSATIGYLLGLCAGRFSVLYFGLLTLALSLVSVEIIGHLSIFTGGDTGIAVPPVYTVILSREIIIAQGLPMTMALATGTYLLADWITSGPKGLQWLAVKTRRSASMTAGLVPHRENALIFAFSAALASVAGVCLSVDVGYLDPEAFNLHVGVMLIVATVVGGVGSLLGSIFGALFIIGVPELARGATDIASFVFGAATIAVLLFLQRGVVPSLVAWTRPRSGRETVPAPISADLPEAETRQAVDGVKPARSTLAVRNVTVQFGGVRALDDVSLTV